MGLTEPGQGVKALKDGTVYPGGALPVNLSGGLKAKGHPVHNNFNISQIDLIPLAKSGPLNNSTATTLCMLPA